MGIAEDFSKFRDNYQIPADLISSISYRYMPKQDQENERIADLLVGLTQTKRSWGLRPVLSVSA